jgi:hypothetical protein
MGNHRSDINRACELESGLTAETVYECIENIEGCSGSRRRNLRKNKDGNRE